MSSFRSVVLLSLMVAQLWGHTLGTDLPKKQGSILAGEVELGEICTKDDDCKGFATETECKFNGFNMRCACNDAHALVEKPTKRCLPVRDLTQSCTNVEQCWGGGGGALSFCRTPQLLCDCPDNTDIDGDECKCKPNLIPNEHQCLQLAKRVGDKCEIDAQCSPLAPGSGAYCSIFGEACKCQTTHVPSNDNTKCLEIKLKLGEQCDEDIQCTSGAPGALSFCSKPDPFLPGTCQCLPTAIKDPSQPEVTCVRKAQQLYEPCRYTEQCNADILYSTCLIPFGGGQHLCACQPGLTHSLDNKKCILMTGQLGDLCETDMQCQFTGGVCSNDTTRTCICSNEGYYQAGDACLKIHKTEGEYCKENKQCNDVSGLGTNSTCNQTLNRCLCKEKFVFFNSTCVEKVELGGTCGLDANCELGVNDLSACVSGRCQCKATLAVEKEKTCWEVKKLEDKCENVMQCNVTIGGAVDCLGGMCTCKEGYSLSGNSTTCSNENGAVPVVANHGLQFISLIILGIAVKLIVN